MTKLKTSATKLRLDVAAGVRNLGREVGLGVVEALNQRPEDKEPGWRAQLLAHGAMLGIDEGLGEEHLHQSLAGTIDGAVDAALSAVVKRSTDLDEMAEDAARAFARGALGEARVQLARPLVLLAVAVGVGVIGALLLRKV